MIYKITVITYWIAVITVLYVYFGYPLLLMFWPRKKTNTTEFGKNEKMPSITVFIPVYNEEKVIEKKILNSLRLDYPSKLFEVIVASDASTDGTNKIINNYANKGLKIFINESNEGKNVLINKYVPETLGEIIVFTDANSMFEADALRHIAMRFNNINTGCVGGHLVYKTGESSTAKGEGFYFKYENLIRKYEGYHGRMIGANGAIYALRRELYIPVPSHVPNDFFHPLSVLKRQFRSEFEEKSIAIEKPSENPKEEFKRRVRIVARSVGTVWEITKRYGFFPGIGNSCLISHKILRWITFPILIAIFFMNFVLLHHPFYFIALYFQIAFYLLGIAGYYMDKIGIRFRIFFIPYYFLLINIAGAFGIFHFLRGNRVVKWKIASTTR